MSVMKPISLARLIQAAGSQSKLADAIGASQQIVSYWASKDKPLPAEYVLAAEAALGISRTEIRPDIYPPEPKADAA